MSLVIVGYFFSLLGTGLIIYFFEYMYLKKLFYWTIPLYIIGLLIVIDILYFLFLVICNYSLSKKRLQKQSRFARYLITEYAYFVDFKMRIIPKAHTNIKNCKGVFIFNHRSLLDPLALESYFRFQSPFYIMKKEIVNWPFAGRLIVKAGSVCIDREDLRQSVRALQEAKEKMGNRNIGIFPEGTRNKTEEAILPFKPGALKIAYQAKADVNVVKLVNFKKAIWNRFRFKKIHPEIFLLKTFTYEEYKDMTTEAFSEAIENLYRK